MEKLEQQMSGMEEKPCPTYSSEKTLFQLLDLEIGDSEEIPAVIFLINDGKVIRIIVMNTDDF